MRQLTEREKKKLLSKVYWDMSVDPEELFQVLQGEATEPENIDKTAIYRRLLTTYDWYTLLRLIPEKQLAEVLSDQVIDRLYPKTLRKRFLYARQVLSG